MTNDKNAHSAPKPRTGRQKPATDATTGPAARHRVQDLVGSGREAILEHDGQDYRLRITASGKLILTK